MSSELPYEAPTRERASENGMPATETVFTSQEIDLGPRPEPTVPDGLTEESVKLVQAIGDYQASRFEQILVSRDANIERMLEENLRSLHDPTNIQFRGILIGAGAVLAALVVLLLIGLLFLYGLSVVQG
jgi:hypothetical protein